MIETKRIDQYICIDTDQIVVDEMNNILDEDIESFHLEEDKKMWSELQAAAKEILRFYKV
jgi:hypothetical protein